jgi:3-keto-5-aminohexanoate cleavage enzyme
MATNKVIVTVAPTGGMASKSANPNLPTQPEEIAESIRRSCEAGAAIAALHARRPDDQATCNDGIYRRINGLIRERCDIIINNSTGGGSSGDMLVSRPDGLFESNFEERLKGLEARAEMATFDCFTAVDTFGEREILVVTTPSRCEAMARRFQERGIKPEWEVFNPAHILQDVTRLIQKGYDKPPYYINMVLGTDRNFQGGMPYSHDILTAMIKLLPPQSIFCVSAIGPAQLPATTQALLLGGHVRVGLEDNNYYSRGVLATNEMLVQRTVRIIKELNLEPASPAEAREILGLPGRAAR